MGLSLASLYATAQEVPKVEKVPQASFQYSGEQVVVNTSTHQTTLLGSVEFKTDLLEIKHADTLLYDQKTDEIVVLGWKEFTFAGALHVTENTTHQRLRYKLGDTIAYLE